MARQSQNTDSRRYVQDLLSRQDYSVAQIRRKLQSRHIPEDTAREAISWAQNHGWLNDADVAERYVISTLRRKAVGPRWLAAKLRAKGIEPQLTAHALAEHLPPAREKKLLAQAAEEWRRRDRKPFQAARLGNFLMSRGFSSELVSGYLGQLS
jgi:regulatory protein